MAHANTVDERQERRVEDDHGRTIAALFRSREEARSALKPLHKAKFTKTWLGTTSIGTRAGETVATVENGPFFAGPESLVDALVKRGVDGDAARHLESKIESGNAVLTIDPGEKAPDEALEIVQRHGGQLAAATNDWKAWPSDAYAGAEDDFDDLTYEEVSFARR